MPTAAALLALLLGASQASEQSEAMETDSGMAMVPRAVQELESPRWIRHKVTPRERLSQIAARYGVKKRHLLEWNRVAPDAGYVRTGRRLRVKARRLPPPRKRITHVVRDGQSWGDIAAQFRVEQRDLRAWNWQSRRARPGRELIVWIDPAVPRTVGLKKGPAITDLDIEDHGLSVGRPNRGRLENGVRLPDSPLYTKRRRAALFGSTHTITQIHDAFAGFRRDSGYDGKVVIGAISRSRGGKFRPHRSHQSGRDIDIRLPLLPGIPDTSSPNADEVDWYATWALVEAFIATDEVACIFLDIERQRRLFEAGRTMGATDEELDHAIGWPSQRGPGRAIVRHSKGHEHHLHIRIKCGPEEPRCRRGS